MAEAIQKVTELGGNISGDVNFDDNIGDVKMTSLNIVNFENQTVYFENNAVFN